MVVLSRDSAREKPKGRDLNPHTDHRCMVARNCVQCPEMATPLIHIDTDSELGLRDQLRQRLVAAILDGALAPGERLPSSRKLSRDLRIARNTVTFAYQQLVDEGYLIARERSGLYVNQDFIRSLLDAPVGGAATPRRRAQIDRLATPSEGLKGFQYPADWQSYPYPFIDGR